MRDIEVIMAAYNGSQFISKMLDSILAQSVYSRIIIKDDGSNDNTPDIIEEYRRDYPERIRVLHGRNFGNARDNFSYILSESKASYVFFADQDDLWMPDKIERMMCLMKSLENKYSCDAPLLVHSDMEVIDENDEMISASLWQYQNLDPNWGNKLNLLLTQNVVTGCTMACNRALILQSLPVPAEAVMHDWWLAIVAAAFGHISFTREATVKYRKHTKNVIGAAKFDSKVVIGKLRGISDTSEFRVSFALNRELEVYNQALAFYTKFPNSSSGALAKRFAELKDKPYFVRMLNIFTFKFFQKGLIRNLTWIVKPRETIYKLKKILRRR